MEQRNAALSAKLNSGTVTTAKEEAAGQLEEKENIESAPPNNNKRKAAANKNVISRKKVKASGIYRSDVHDGDDYLGEGELIQTNV